MKVISGSDINQIHLAATIGFFDGVHTGHQHLINQVIAISKNKQLASGVVTFKEHPRKVIQPDYQPDLITSHEERIQLLSQTGIDYCIVLDFNFKIAQLTAKEFIKQILGQRFSVKSLIVGHDHKFGKDRSDDYTEYVQYGHEAGIEVIKADAFQIDKINVSSSMVRKLLSEGKIDRATKFLGRHYSIQGLVVEGLRIGRTIGYPTANIKATDPEKIVPSFGVYAVKALVGNIVYGGMLNIGIRPTISENNERSIEANLFDFSGDIYGQPITVYFIEKIRDERKMNGLEDLKRQLNLDRINALHILGK